MYRLLSRVSLAAACSGLAISTVLTLFHATNMPLPCGGSSGCERVAEDASSVYMGIPISVYGIAGYTLLLVVAILRILGIKFNFSSLVGLFASGVGTIGSAVLTYHSITVIHAICVWCIGSATMMTVSLLSYLAMSKAKPEDRKEIHPARIGAWAAVPILIISGIAVFDRPGKVPPPDLSSVDITKASLAELVGSSRSQGSPDAPVTIAEFADLSCPACREMNLRLTLFMARTRGKARLLYHHFPLSTLPGHEQSTYAAQLSSQLNDDDFWNFVNKVYGLPEEPKRADLDRIFAEMKGKRIRTPQEAETEVARDVEIGTRYGIKQTPTYILFIGNKPMGKASSYDLKDVISLPAFKKIFTARAPSKASK
jgi:uncharacterized membrane protein